uniref:Clathrin light chain n=1 Tax=Amphora coffeiformis TaxID=265554 RepID=A0A7S3LET1_9STRA|mmetsp:Transcript_15611/g.29821  ORF Transcript_15611/g.29821 Transcript_15611/m.29821 type:complete len:195 (-) Transcript_15611:17-601(-)|eukprot:scaffold212_cov173-Amphora_coffeaeformis.AAC.10
MSEDADFFSVPPSSSDAVGDEPIILGDAPPPDFAAAPAADESPFMGDVTDAPPPPSDAPIVLGGDDEMPPPPESSGPTPMQKWNEEWQETLKVRKEEENARKAELVEAARVALEAFQAEREVKRQSKMTKNREDEQAKLEAIEADLENDNSWQRVCKMIELSHDSTAKSADVKRMRDVLILLKNEPTRAEALTN